MKSKKNINPKSLDNLQPDNRLQGYAPKKRINIVLDPYLLHLLRETGNVSGSIETIIAERVEQEYIHQKILEILEKVEKKESGYKMNSASKLIKDLKNAVNDKDTMLL